MLNKVIIMGNLTRDPELRTIGSSGNSVVDLGIAMNRQFTSNGEKKEETTFVDVTFWGKQAEILAEHTKKGRQLLIEGRLSLDTWEGNEGEKRSKLKVIGENFTFVGGKKDDADQTSTTASSSTTSRPVVVEVADDDDVPF